MANYLRKNAFSASPASMTAFRKGMGKVLLTGAHDGVVGDVGIVVVRKLTAKRK